jgi:sugar lactone lactonase YvrE
VLDVGADEAGDRYDGFALVLVRPDQHVAWRSSTEPDADEAAAVLDVVTGRSIGAPVVAEWTAEPLADGFLFGEGLRWRPTAMDDAGGSAGDEAGDGRAHAGYLVFSDMTSERLLRADPSSGALEVVADVPGRPNGLGLLPDGRLVVASMIDRRLLVERTAGDPGAGFDTYADLSALATGYLGDIAVDAAGRVFVGDTGARVLHGEPFTARLGRLLRVDGPGRAEVALDGLAFPNGMVVTPDGQMLILGLSGTGRIVQCRIHSRDGSLGPLRPFATQLPDGLAIDASGGVWACHPGRGEVTRYDPGGRRTGRVRIPDGRAIACALDPSSSTLFVTGIRPLAPGDDLFAAIAERRTRGVLWRAALG